jgi:hypothetical protein
MIQYVELTSIVIKQISSSDISAHFGDELYSFNFLIKFRVSLCLNLKLIIDNFLLF